jgi:peptide deformylase
MNILTVPDRCLAQVCSEVPKGEECRPLIDAMFDTIENSGIGLAAPQVGEDKRIIVISYMSTKYAIINPVIEFNKKLRPRLVKEGCLSVPGQELHVRRWRKVKVSGFDRNWVPVEVGGKDFIAAIFQHEIDHLNGITIDQVGEYI